MQQLLLITLGVIIVGIAVTVGIRLFQASYADTVSTMIIQRFNELTADALLYYKTPVQMGGGGNTFTGFNPADNTSLSYTYTTYTTASATDVTIYLISKTTNTMGQPTYCYGTLNRTGITYIILWDPEKNQWLKLFPKT